VYPKARLDALGDAIFGVAMTLLALDVRLPDSFQPDSAASLIHGIAGLWEKFVPYLLSFLVLGLRWLSNVHVRSRGEAVGRTYGIWWLFYLLLITCVPFTTIVLGRFGTLAPAIWLYAGNTALIAFVSFRLLSLTPEIERRDHLLERKIGLTVLLVSAMLAILVSFFAPRRAMLALLLNTLAPLAQSRVRRDP
jgi:uncharacterized membrane protein